MNEMALPRTGQVENMAWLFSCHRMDTFFFLGIMEPMGEQMANSAILSFAISAKFVANKLAIFAVTNKIWNITKV